MPTGKNSRRRLYKFFVRMRRDLLKADECIDGKSGRQVTLCCFGLGINANLACRCIKIAIVHDLAEGGPLNSKADIEQVL